MNEVAERRESSLQAVIGSPISWLVPGILYLGLSLVLPIAFHQFGMGGRTFLPMHIPSLLAGFHIGPVGGMLVGLLAPLLSHNLTGMPPTYAVPLMTVELAMYGLTAGVLYRRLGLNVYLALIMAMLSGRILFGLALFMLAPLIELPYSAGDWFSTGGAMLTGWPGMLVQLLIIPPIVAGTRVLSRR